MNRTKLLQSINI